MPVEKPKLKMDWFEFTVARQGDVDFAKKFGARLKALKGRSETTGKIWKPRRIVIPWSKEGCALAVECVQALPYRIDANGQYNMNTKIVGGFVPGLSVPSIRVDFEEKDMRSGAWVSLLEKALIDYVDKWWERSGYDEAERREKASQERAAEQSRIQADWLARIKKAVVKGDDKAILEVLKESRESIYH